MANQPSSVSRTGRAAPPVGTRDGKDEGLPGLAALDPAKAVRPNKTDDGSAFDAPPVVASRRDEPGQWAEAPEVAAEFDRPGLASRPEVEMQRPVAPGAEVAKPRRLLWIAAAVVLGIVLAVAGAAILMRQKPQDLAIKPPVEAQQPAPPESSAKIAERVQTAPTTPSAPASAPPATPSNPQSAAAPATPAAPEAPAQPAQSAAPPTPSAGRAAMLIASADNPQKPAVSLGSTVWSLIPPAPNQPATVAVKAEADIPDLKMHATMTLRKNTDPTLQATHTIDLKFSFAEGAPVTGFKDVGLPQMRKEDSTAAEALTSVKVKISDTYFLIALAKGEADTARNLDLMQTRSWFDFPLLLNDDRIAKVVFQKSPEGQAMLEKAFEAWK
jgi:cytoskeletal protein RodZ